MEFINPFIGEIINLTIQVNNTNDITLGFISKDFSCLELFFLELLGKFEIIYFILEASKVWNGGGEDNFHSKVVAPSPHGLFAADFFLIKA